MRSFIALMILFPVVCQAAPVPKGATKPTWVGKPAFLKNSKAKLTIILSTGNERTISVPQGTIAYLVKDVQDDRVEIIMNSAITVPNANAVAAPVVRTTSTSTQKVYFRRDDVMKATEAIDYYTDILKTNEKDLFYRLARAEANTAAEKWDAADIDYSKAIEIDSNVNLRMKRAAFRMMAKKFEGAIQDYDAIVEQNPGYRTWGLQQKANAKAGMKKFDEAIADLTVLVDEGPNRSSGLLTRGLMYARAGKPEKAIEDYDEIIKGDPTSAIAINNKAWTLCTTWVDKARDGKEAVKLATKACELTEWKNAGYIDTLAAAYAEVGEFDKAVKYQTQVLDDADLVQREGAELKDRLELYKQKKPYRLPDETKPDTKPRR